MTVLFPAQMAGQCMVLKTRRAARAVTRRYNVLLKPYALQSTQASLLFAIAKGGFESISELAEQMAIERSALTRNLRLLQEAGYATSQIKGRGRAQRVELTQEGEALLETLLPLWVEAQDGLRKELGEREWANAQAALSLVGQVG